LVSTVLRNFIVEAAHTLQEAILEVSYHGSPNFCGFRNYAYHLNVIYFLGGDGVEA
jgi:hypothetical protein